MSTDAHAYEKGRGGGKRRTRKTAEEPSNNCRRRAMFAHGEPEDRAVGDALERRAFLKTAGTAAAFMIAGVQSALFYAEPCCDGGVKTIEQATAMDEMDVMDTRPAPPRKLA